MKWNQHHHCGRSVEVSHQMSFFKVCTCSSYVFELAFTFVSNLIILSIVSVYVLFGLFDCDVKSQRAALSEWSVENMSITLHWRNNEHDGVSNHQPHDCLLKRLFRRRSKETSKLRVTGLCVRGIHRWPVNSPHKGPVTTKMFPIDDVTMAFLALTCRYADRGSTLIPAWISSYIHHKMWNAIT